MLPDQDSKAEDQPRARTSGGKTVTMTTKVVPLKKITTEVVAEALLDIYSRVGIPEEVLTHQGTQFISECMQEVSRLLSIKGLTCMPYHPFSPFQNVPIIFQIYSSYWSDIQLEDLERS